MTDPTATVPTVRMAGDTGPDDPTMVMPAPVVDRQPNSRLDAIRAAGKAARRKRYWDVALDWHLPPGVAPLGIRLGLPTSTDVTVVMDAAGFVDANADVAFLAHDFLSVIEFVDGEWTPIDTSLRELARHHAAGMEGRDDVPAFETDEEALQQLYTLNDPPQVNVQGIVSLAQAYRQWAVGGADEDGDPTVGP